MFVSLLSEEALAKARQQTTCQSQLKIMPHTKFCDGNIIKTQTRIFSEVALYFIALQKLEIGLLY